MARHIDHPDVDVYTVYSQANNDNAQIVIGPTTATITTTHIKFDPETENMEEHEQSVVMTRHTLIGLAYEILSNIGEHR